MATTPGISFAIGFAALIFTIIMLYRYLVLTLAFISSLQALPWAPGASSSLLRFTNEGTFQITVFEDLHFGEAEDLCWGPLQDAYSLKVMNTVLDNESPQLVVLNGDLITGENTYLHNSSLYVDEIVKPLIQRDLPWASTYGNHDSQFNLSRQDIYARERRYSNSLTGNMVSSPNAGVTNYYLPVYSADGSRVEVILWFFDSRGGYYFQKLDEEGNQIPQPEWVDESVVQWYQNTIEALSVQYGRTIPSLAFYHIPVNAMLAYQETGVDATKDPGINDDNPLAQQGLDNNSTYIGTDIPFMSAMLHDPGLMATFSGHDHGDDWCFKWEGKLPGMSMTGNGLDLCFGRHTGYGGYGTWTRGSRQILLDQRTLGKETKTWVRLEDGLISGLVMLNGTYGTDSYAAVADTDTQLPDC